MVGLGEIGVVGLNGRSSEDETNEGISYGWDMMGMAKWKISIPTFPDLPDLVFSPPITLICSALLVT